jgi:large subunit ribosomal protein L17
MRHRRKTVKLQRKTAHRNSMLANQACSLIEHRQIKTTLAKAKALRPIADRLLTLGKRALSAPEDKDKIHYRRLAYARLGANTVAKRAVKKLFDEIAPASADRAGGYTRITKLGQRQSDAAPMAFIGWVDFAIEEDFDDE